MSEKDIQKKIKIWLELKGCHVLKYNVDGYASSGEPDLFATLPIGNGKSLALFIEVKTESGRLSSLQRFKLNKLRKDGNLALVATSVRSIGVYLTKNGVKLPEIKELPSYSRYMSMRRRCLDTKYPKYKNYGGRGITICKKWLDDSMGYYNFIDDMGLPPSQSLSLNRIDNNGNYSPENCEWATSKTQMNNTTRNRVVVANGMSKTLSQWEDYSGIKSKTISVRLSLGWTPEDAVSVAPLVGRNQHSRSL